MSITAFRATGALIDLTALSPADIDFAEMAATLSKIARFNGSNRGVAYSVAQHSVMGADALYRETGDAVCAGYFLIHDGHENLIGDITRPTLQLIDHYIARVSKEAARLAAKLSIARLAIASAKADMDAVIFAAANLPPISRIPAYARHVRDMDERMCAAEARALFGVADNPAAPSQLPPPKLIGAIEPWGAMKAEAAFIDRLQKYLGIVARV